MSEAQSTQNQTARRKAATAFNDRVERQQTADAKRVEEQRLIEASDLLDRARAEP